MNRPHKFSISPRLQSFANALNGMMLLFREEHNAKIHLSAVFLTVALGFILNISIAEWLAVLLSIALVISLELVNSAIENLCDFVSPKKDDRIKNIKDLAAGAVLWSAILAFVLGTIIFVPKLWQLII